MILAKWLPIIAVCFAAPGCGSDKQTPSNQTKPQAGVLVGAASSLTDVMKDLGGQYVTDSPGTAVQFSYDSSGNIEHQIELGAPIDVFVSAGTKEMDELAAKHLIDPETRTDVASNKLVLVCPVSRSAALKDWKDLTKSGITKIGISNPASVPSGRYAKEALDHLGLWDALKGKLVFGENVRQTVRYVVAGDVDAAIVFKSDTLNQKGLVIVATAKPGVDHKPIVYPAAVVSASPNKEAAAKFVKYLASKPAQPEWKRFGF